MKPPHLDRLIHGANATPGSLPKQAVADDVAETPTSAMATEQRDLMAYLVNPSMAAERNPNMPRADELGGAMTCKPADFSQTTHIEQRQPKGAVMPNA